MRAWKAWLLALSATLLPTTGCEDSTDPPAAVVSTCRAPLRPGATGVHLERRWPSTTFASPVELVPGPGGRFYVLEQAGVVRSLTADTAPAKVVLNIAERVACCGESGLLGLAFDPAFDRNGFAYVYYTHPKPGVVFESVVARFHSSDGGETFDPGSETRIFAVDQPYSNHNGGHLAVGPDGMLYLSLGDGGSGGDPENRSQNLQSYLGKILRFDVRSEPYAIPETNPFAKGGGLPEIYAYGLRNVWKFSFDRGSGKLFAGDVGQGSFEEIDEIVLGGNYGWRLREGKHCYLPSTGCEAPGLVDPIWEYGRTEGVSVTGGYVYRGAHLPALAGKYVYGDFASGRIWALDLVTLENVLVLAPDVRVSTFGQGQDGEMYVADYATGAIFALAPGDEAGSTTLAEHLVDTGCIVDLASGGKPPPGDVIPYEVNSPLWSDGADKTRWVSLPPGGRIGVADDGDFDLPIGTVAVKTFRLPGRTAPVETRLFVRHADGGWAGYTYEWNDAGTDATLLTGSKLKAVGDRSWYYPSRGECMVCHTQVAGSSLGLEARQLNRLVDGRNQLDRFGPYLANPIARARFSPLASATSSASAEDRARSYLHANCSMCHRPGSGAGGAAMDLRFATPLQSARICDLVPEVADYGIEGARLVAPGYPERSLIWRRMVVDTAGGGRMPNIATSVVDTTGAAAVGDWIKGLGVCP